MDFDDLTPEYARRYQGIKWNRYGPDVIPSWVADMDFPVARPIRDYVKRLGELGDLGYTATAPHDPICEAFAERMARRYAWRPDPADMEDLVDVVQGLYLAVRLLCADDEKVVVQTPIYHPILNACRDLDREILYNPLVKTRRGWRIDFERLEARIDARTRLLMLVNPHNPSGRAFRRRELERLAEIALRNDLVVASDEIHCDLVYPDGGRHVPFASLGPEIAARTVTFNSATKSHNLGGARCAVVHYGSRELRGKFDRIPPHMRGGGNAIGHGVTRIAWQQCDDWLAALLRYLEGNRNFLVENLEKRFPGIRHLPNEATFLAWLDCTELGLDDEPFDFFLRHARVAFHPGLDFGPEGRGHVRLNFATSRSILACKLDRMERALERAGSAALGDLPNRQGVSN